MNYCDNTRVRPLGTFIVGNGEVIVSDPCYNLPKSGVPDSSPMGHFENAKQGIWHAYTQEGTTDWGFRIWALFVMHDTVLPNFVHNFTCNNFLSKNMTFHKELAVDSGQMGIFDIQHFKNSLHQTGTKYWYDKCCEVTLSSSQAGIMDGGCISSTGFGDGSYGCYYETNDENLVVAIGINFITEEDFNIS